jgi:hypothetical protein
MRGSARERCAKCGVVRIADVEIRKRDGTAHYHGLLRCGSVWECPVCAGQISAERANEITQLTKKARAEGLDVSLLTLTVRHGMGDNLKAIRAGVAKALTRMKSGRQWQLFGERVGLFGMVRAMEVTHGPTSGFHPHLHLLVLHRKLSPSEATEARSWLSERWQRYVVRFLGEEHKPELERGCDFRPCRNDKYLAKMGLELTLDDTKKAKGGNRGMWQVAEDFQATGDCADLAIWRTYCDGMLGARQLVWGKGLKAWAGIGEKTDEEIVQGEDAVEELVVSIPVKTWKQVCLAPNMDGLLAHLLDVAETGGRKAVEKVLASLPPLPRWKAEQRRRRQYV